MPGGSFACWYRASVRSFSIVCGIFPARRKIVRRSSAWRHHERMQFIALDYLHRGLEPRHHAVGERLAGVAAIDQHAFHARQIWLRTILRPQRAFAVGHIRRAHGDGVGQALRVNAQRAGHGVAPQFDAGRAKRFVKARSSALVPSGAAALHLAKYKYTVTPWGNPSGNMRHWQPLLSR